MTRLAFDVEANGLLDEATRIHCIVTKDLDTGEVKTFSRQKRDGEPESVSHGVLTLEEADELWAHNGIKFDIPVLQKLYDLNTTDIRIRDTLVCLRLIRPDTYDLDAPLVKRQVLPQNLMGSHSLQAWGHRIGVHKQDYRGGFEKFSQEMLDYCVQDVEVLAELVKRIESKKYSQQAIDLEHDFAQLIFQQEQNGFGIDLTKARALHAELMGRHDEILSELQEVFPPRVQQMKSKWWVTEGGKQFATKKEARESGYPDVVPGPHKTKEIPFNPSSRPECADRLRQKYGWEAPVDEETGKPKLPDNVFDDLEYPEAKLIAEMLMIRKRLGQLADGRYAWMGLEKNGKIHGSVNTNGAVTGRCTHSRPNMAQVPKASEKVPYGKQCRALFTPTRPGWKLVGCDASGLELRCLAHYMAAWDDGAYGQEVIDGDVHTTNQEAAGLDTRDDAKTFIYAFIYGAGDGKLGAIAKGGSRKGKQLRAKFLQELPALDKLIKGVQSKAKKSKVLRGLDGRLLHVRSPHSALNTLLQSAGAVVMKQALVCLVEELEDKGWEMGVDFALCANIHDEFQVECTERAVPFLLKAGPEAITRAGEILGFRVPLDGEAKVGNNWAETH